MRNYTHKYIMYMYVYSLFERLFLFIHKYIQLQKIHPYNLIHTHNTFSRNKKLYSYMFIINNIPTEIMACLVCIYSGIYEVNLL